MPTIKRLRKSTAGLMDRVVPTARRIFDGYVCDKDTVSDTADMYRGWAEEVSDTSSEGTFETVRWTGAQLNATKGEQNRLPIVGRTIYDVRRPQSNSPTSSQSTSAVATPDTEHPDPDYYRQIHGFTQPAGFDFYKPPTEAGLCSPSGNQWPIESIPKTRLENTWEMPLAEQEMFDRYLNFDECCEDWHD